MLAQTFTVELEGVGTFTFRDKTFRDQVRIESMVSEILGRSPSSMRSDEMGISAVAFAIAHATVLVVEAPNGWNVDALDPFEDEDAAQLMTLHGRLVEQLARFRGERKQARAA